MKAVYLYPKDRAVEPGISENPVRYQQDMTPQFKHIITVLSIFLLTGAMTNSFACTCIGRDKQTTGNELTFVDIAVKGRIISVTNFDYYDTLAYALAGFKFDPKQAGYLIRKYKLFTLLVANKFKAIKNMADTIQVVTGYGGGDCGYEFEVGKEYIVYGQAWKEKAIAVRYKRRKDKRRITEIVIANKFYTDICRLTQDTNPQELENLERLTLVSRRQTKTKQPIAKTKRQEQTLTLIYNAISCTCAQWSEMGLSKDKDKKQNYWLEPANENLINADTLFDGENLPVIIIVTGQLVTENGFPKREFAKVVKGEASKVFRYTKIEVIQNGQKKKGR